MVKHCGFEEKDLGFTQHNIEHHLAHTASAYFISPWEHAAGFTLDGSGDFVTCMLTECTGNKIDVKKRIYVPNSLGSLYTMVAEFIGYTRYGDEGKVMGLAPYGKPTYTDVFSEMINFTKDGVTLNPKFFMPFGSNQGMTINEKGQMEVHRHHTDEMIKQFGQPREFGAEITQRDMDLGLLPSRYF